jgi:phage shock protein PspC (stress-responsive transcriptional regulator)
MASTSTDRDETAEDPAPRGEPSFFRWIRSLGLVRGAGWLGGVCAAIAGRTRLDPILVRGIVVVLAVLGAPVVLLYAAAWFLLPDEKGGIHALRLAHGRVEGAVVAIAGLVLLSFLPLTQGFWWAGATYWGEPNVLGSVGRILWTAVVIAVGVIVLVWLARRAAHPDVQTVPATTDDRPDTVPRPAEFAAAPADVVAPGGPEPAGVTPRPDSPAAAEPPPPAADAPAAELAAWREQQRLWQQQRAAWAAQQRRDERARRAAAQAAWVHERDARLAEHRRREPFVGGAVIGVVLGLAVVVGCAVGLAVAVAVPQRPVGWSAGLASAVAVFGLALAIAGLARRRAGALAAFAILALVGALFTAPLAAERVPLLRAGGLDTTRSARYAVIGGDTTLSVYRADRAPGTTVDVWQRAGHVEIRVADGQRVRVQAALSDGGFHTVRYADEGGYAERQVVHPGSRVHGADRYDLHFGGAGPADVTIRLTLVMGSVIIGTDPTLDGVFEGSATPTPSPTSTSLTATPTPTETSVP